MKNLWRKVEDGLPKQGQRVLVYSTYYNKDPILTFRIIDAQFISTVNLVSHWMPLEAPNDEEVTK